jgi:pimeloyl-ACP methyl ester carboxylesterase
VIAPALAGFGGSDPLPLGRQSLTDYAAHVAAYLDAIGLEKPAFIVGHSYGGGVALLLARIRPDLVRSLTLVNTIGGTPGRRGLRRGSWLGWAIGALGELQPRDLLAFAPVTLRDFVPNLLRRPLSMATTCFVALTAALEADAAHLVEAGVPLLFVWSDQDRLVVPGGLQSIASRLGHETVTGRHGWLLSAPAQFAELLRNALTIHVLLERAQRRDRAPKGPA